MKKAVFALVLLTAMIAFAQRAEFGGLIGGGAFAISTGGAAARGQAGVEACVFCSGRLGLFGEYSHWFSGDATQSTFFADRVTSADLAGAGLRIQSRGHLRVFSMSARWRDGMSTLTAAEVPWAESWWGRVSKFPGANTGTSVRRSALMGCLPTLLRAWACTGRLAAGPESATGFRLGKERRCDSCCL